MVVEQHEAKFLCLRLSSVLHFPLGLDGNIIMHLAVPAGSHAAPEQMLQHRNSGQASWPSPGGQPSSDAAQVHEYKRQPWEQLSHAKKLPVLDQGSGLPPACPAVDQLKSEPALFARAQAKAQSQPHMQRPEGLCRSSDAPAMDQQTRTSNSGARPPVPRPGSDSGQDKPCWSLRCTRVRHRLRS